jgi:hypothetical protein
MLSNSGTSHFAIFSCAAEIFDTIGLIFPLGLCILVFVLYNGNSLVFVIKYNLLGSGMDRFVSSCCNFKVGSIFDAGLK